MLLGEVYIPQLIIFMTIKNKLIINLVVYWVLLWIYAIWSYSLVDPNLTLWSNETFINFTSSLQQVLLSNRTWLTLIFGILVVAMWVLYLSILRLTTQLSINYSKKLSIKLFFLGIIFILPLLLTYNALSHDIFNYIFNARMVIEYQANPHQQVALNFPMDTWTRFMHNTHTPAPYWYGWTIMTLLPYLLGLKKFLITWLIFKGFSGLSFLLTGAVIFYLLNRLKQSTLPFSSLVILILNPLILIEIVGNAHNDLWMMLPFLVSLLLIIRNRKSFMSFFYSILLLLVSISIKYATAILVPLWLLFVGLQFSDDKTFYLTKTFHFLGINNLQKNNRNLGRKLLMLIVFLCMSVLAFIPLFLERSRWFLPWYLSWSLVFAPMIILILNYRSELKSKKYWNHAFILWIQRFSKLWLALLVGFSLSSLLRYLPWLLTGDFIDQVIVHQIGITWIVGIMISLMFLLMIKLMKIRL